MSNIEYQRDWRKNNKAKVLASQRKYREANKDKLRADRLAWEVNNKARVKQLKRNWYDANKETSYASSRRSAMMRLYGITPEQAEDMLKEQGGVCKICQCDDPGGKGWCVDHCHVTSIVRGILCSNCNLMLGYARDRKEVLAAAAKYLEGAK